MSARTCIVPLCGQKAKRSACCNQLLCDGHAESVRNHDCPTAKRLEEIASDPKKLRAWKKAQEPEERLTDELVDALNATGLGAFWRSRKRGGVRANDGAVGVLDISGVARPDGVAIFVETKKGHADNCACEHCEGQRVFAENMRNMGAVAVLGVRTIAQGVDGVKMGLARARGSERRAG